MDEGLNESDEAGFLSRAEWDASRDSRELLRHAVPLIPRQHLSLVLAELALDVWPHWNARHPEDWRPGWCIATLVAWCFGYATASDARAAREAAWAARLHWSPRAKMENTSSFAAHAAAYAASVAATYVTDLQVASGAFIPAESADAATSLAYWAASACPDPGLMALRDAADHVYTVDRMEKSAASRIAACAADHAVEMATEDVVRRRLGESAERVRALVPYPSNDSTRWAVSKGTVIAGYAELHLDGWQILRAVGRRDMFPRPSSFWS